MRGRWTSFVPTALGLAVALALASAVTLTQSRTEEASLDQTVNSLGYRECMKVVGGNYVVCIHVAGIWRALNTKDAYWGPEQSVPIAAFTDVPTYFSVLNGEGALDGQLQLVSVATATLSPDKNTIRRLGAQASLNGLRRLHGQLGARRADEV